MDEHRPGETRTQQLRPKEKIARLPDIPEASWREQLRRKPGEELLKNMAVAAALVMCAITLRGGALPQAMDVTDAVMTAVTGDTLLDDQLGKLSFVSALFPEATLVFGQTSPGEALAMPVSGGSVVHAWSEDEPYMAWRTGSAQITSSMDGEVIGVYHGNGEERLVQVLGDDGLSCLYGNLGEVSVSMGDAVSAGDSIGTLMPGADFVMEVRRDGYSVDPAVLLDSAS